MSINNQYKSCMRYFIRPDKNRIIIKEDPDEAIPINEESFNKIRKLYNFRRDNNNYYCIKNEKYVAFRNYNNNTKKYEYYLSKKFIHTEILRTNLQILKDIAKDFTIFDETFTQLDKKRKLFYEYIMKNFYSFTVNTRNVIGNKDE